MSKTPTTTPREEKPTRFYQRASFPWAIIVLTATLAAGFILGWHTQQGLTQEIDAKAQTISARLK